MKALLIGGIGYVGGRLSAYLKGQGHVVAVTTRRPRHQVPSWLQADEVISQPDFRDSSALFEGRDIVVHLAAPDELAAERQPLEALNAGTELTWSILESMAAARPAPCPLIYLSTFHVYGKSARGELTEATPPHPVHPYGLARYLGECVVRSFRDRNKVRALCVRMSNSFGAPAGFDVPRWSLIFNDLCRQAARDNAMVLKTPGLQERNFITLHDASRGIEFLARQPDRWPEDGLLHLGSQAQVTILRVAEMIASSCKDLWGTTPRIVKPDPKPGDRSEPFSFGTQRLAAMGFIWDNPVLEEIKATLELCRKNLNATSPST